MAKTFFQGLGQQASKFEDVLSVPVFDEAGSMRQADAILKDISKRFEGMTDKEINEAINKIGGPEGLRGALEKVKSGANDMIATFDAFDSSQFSLEDALKNAEGDFGKMKEIFFNRMDVVMSKLGEKIIPMLASLFDTLTPVLGFLNDNMEWLLPVFGTFIGLLGAAAIAMWALNSAMFANPIVWIVALVGGLIALIVVAINKFDEWGAAILFLMGPVGTLISVFKTLYDNWQSIKDAFTDGGIIEGFKRIGQVVLGALIKPLEQAIGWVADLTGSDWLNAAHQRLQKISAGLNLKTEPEKEKEKKKDGSLLPDTEDEKETRTDLGGTITKTTGAATSAKNINIKIEALHKGDVNVNGQAGRKLNFNEFESMFEEMMMRVVRNAEMS
jgi:hypothetical protein